eukprot:TRINITY_DN2049_c0_g1_i1.p1 TRINITY_DN2049_c0_g1~~TRINITY_DN2049_c0_g1_i1.p1  ORF type:complete len:370 (+),score=26.94 TRINITY_DN2049_c0_g1_i1:166-1275(+)
MPAFIAFVLAILSHGTPALGALPLTEFTIIEQLHAACTGWLFPFDATRPCSWLIIRCTPSPSADGVSYVSEIRVPFMSLQCRADSFPPSFREFSHLNSVELRAHFGGVIFPYLPDGLQLLRLSDAGFSGDFPALPASLQVVDIASAGQFNLGPLPNFPPNASEIIITGARRTGPLPLELPESLTRLALDNNLLTGSIPEYYGNLPALRHLGLHRNSLSGSIPRSLENVAQRFTEQPDPADSQLSEDEAKPLNLVDNLFEPFETCPTLPEWLVAAGITCPKVFTRTPDITFPQIIPGPPRIHKPPPTPSERVVQGIIHFFIGGAITLVALSIVCLATRFGRLFLRRVLMQCCGVGRQGAAYSPVEMQVIN